VVPLDGHLATGPLALDGGVLILCVDRSSEQAMARMRADFVANASHELRTPLTVLVGFIETLRGSAADDPAAQARFLAIMAEQGARMARLIDDLLSLSRLEMTEHQPPVTQIAVVPLLEQVVAGIGTILAGRGMRVVTGFAANIPTVAGDADQLIQVAQNLLDNAVKYGRDNGIIRVAVRMAETDRAWPSIPGLVISVTDDGIGIPREHLPRLTERFYRVDAGRSRAMGGTGLGLAIVKHIVNRHRGDMRIESVEGEGTTVSIWLPRGASMSGEGNEASSS
jgi:two-component system phosphate regulon sensor histidine kinase PhoR